jgi:hypothetical protein
MTQLRKTTVARILPDYPKTIQLWPGGESVTIRGSNESLRVRVNERWKKPSKELARKIEIELRAELYAERDILCCDSAMVDDCIKMGFESNSEFAREWSFDNVANYYVDPSEWDLAECKEWLEDHDAETPGQDPWTMDEDAFAEFLDLDIDEVKERTKESLVEDAVTDIESGSEISLWRNAVREHADEHRPEIYMWFRVNGFLADYLKEIGECVMDNSYGTWFGRTCCGQSILMDGTLQRVAELLLDRYG